MNSSVIITFFVNSGLLDDNCWIGRCSSKEVETAARALCATSPDAMNSVVEALAKAACNLHPLKRERMELSAVLKEFYIEAYPQERYVFDQNSQPQEFIMRLFTL